MLYHKKNSFKLISASFGAKIRFVVLEQNYFLTEIPDFSNNGTWHEVSQPKW